MRPEDWHDAHLLFAFACPCDVVATVNQGIATTPADQPDVADHWLRIGTCVAAIMNAVTVH